MKNITRRQMLTTTAVGAAGTALAACGTSGVTIP